MCSAWWLGNWWCSIIWFPMYYLSFLDLHISVIWFPRYYLSFLDLHISVIWFPMYYLSFLDLHISVIWFPRYYLSFLDLHISVIWFPRYYLSFLDLHILITPLISSIYSYSVTNSVPFFLVPFSIYFRQCGTFCFDHFNTCCASINKFEQL